MATTARTLILSALRKIRAVSPEETPPAYQIENGLEALNDLLSSWAAERLLVYSIAQRTGALVNGTNSYTIGSGATFNLTRPQRIERAFIRISNIDYPLEIVTRDSYMGIPDKTAAGQPDRLYYDASYSQGKVYVYPTPEQSYTLYMDNWEPLTEFATSTTSYTFPLEYKLAIKTNLPLVLAPEYGKTVDPDLRELARTSKGAIKRLNHQPMTTRLDYFGTAGRSHIETDT
jgi:hypothetical protein